jgi:hypothetical protein
MNLKEEDWFIIGSLISDCHISKKCLILSQCFSHLFYIKKFMEIMNEKYNIQKNYKIYDYGNTKIIKGKLHNTQPVVIYGIYKKDIINQWLKIKEDFFSGNIYPTSIQDKISFIEGFWYGDGSFSISSNKNSGGFKPTIGFHNKNLNTIKIAEKVMKELNFSGSQIEKQSENYYILRYSGELEKFIKTFKPMMKINIDRLKNFLIFWKIKDNFEDYLEEYKKINYELFGEKWHDISMLRKSKGEGK